jgi:hypothetical protein
MMKADQVVSDNLSRSRFKNNKFLRFKSSISPLLSPITTITTTTVI